MYQVPRWSKRNQANVSYLLFVFVKKYGQVCVFCYGSGARRVKYIEEVNGACFVFFTSRQLATLRFFWIRSSNADAISSFLHPHAGVFRFFFVSWLVYVFAACVRSKILCCVCTGLPSPVARAAATLATGCCMYSICCLYT